LKGVPKIPPMLVTQMMCPSLLDFMLGSTALVRRNTPKKLVSNTFLVISIVWVSSAPDIPIPALLTGNITVFYINNDTTVIISETTIHT